MISGPSGAGKSSIVAGLRKRRPFHYSVSATTRAPRPGEIDGVDYHFVDPDTFEEMIERDELLEWARYNGNYYGTPRAAVADHLEVGDDVVLEIEVQGARQVHERMPETVMIFIEPPGAEALEQRLRSRGDTSEPDIKRRIEIARSELALAADLFDHVVVNQDLDQTVAAVERLMAVSL